MRQWTRSLKAGVEVNPGADEIGLVANWRLLDETARRPALILGTSSDRIGTPAGQSYYATLSKSLHRRQAWILLRLGCAARRRAHVPAARSLDVPEVQFEAPSRRGSRNEALAR